MLNSAQGSEDNKKENKRKAHASVFDRSEAVGRYKRVVGLDTPIESENDLIWLPESERPHPDIHYICTKRPTGKVGEIIHRNIEP